MDSASTFKCNGYRLEFLQAVYTGWVSSVNVRGSVHGVKFLCSVCCRY